MVKVQEIDNESQSGYLIRNMKNTDLEKVVKIHVAAFDGFFLTMLGDKFLYNLYRSFLNDNFSICIVAEINSEIAGFVIGNLKPDKLFLKMLINRGFLFLFYSFGAILKNPKAVSGKLFYALRYRGEPPSGYQNPALLSSIGVNPSKGTKGIGSELVKAFCSEAFLKGAGVVYLTCNRFDNDKVNSFYIKNGFQLLDVLENTRGRELNRYIKLSDFHEV